MRVAEKKDYVKPELIAYGRIETITKGSSSGAYLDQGFPQGTPYGSLTFS
jgi:hypothetical protein